MSFPLLPRTEADAILEAEHYAEEAYYENLAELGSSAFYGGASSADANLLAQQQMAERLEDFRQSEEGERHFDRLAAAKLFEDVRGLALSNREIPEFTGLPGYSALVLSDDIPF
jgi:hypothetical protein